jgi:hypothetical protein
MPCVGSDDPDLRPLTDADDPADWATVAQSNVKEAVMVDWVLPFLAGFVVATWVMMLGRWWEERHFWDQREKWR